jgi:hypothetical protein
MVRLTGVILLLILSLPCIAAPMFPHTPTQPDSAAQPPAIEQKAAEQTAIAPSPTPYPLDAFPEFSAVMFGSRVEPGEGTEQGHIYRAGKLIRMEDPGKRGYYITDLVSGETYGLSKAGCMHDSHPFIRSFPLGVAAKPSATVTRAPAGKETLDGHACQIENVTVSSSAFANPLQMRFWEAEDLQGFPIKIEFLLPGGHDAIVRYKSVVLGPQDPTLFIHPESCAQLSKRGSTPKAPPNRIK